MVNICLPSCLSPAVSSSSVAQVRKRIISWGNKVVIIPFWSTGVPLLTDRLMQAMVWGGWVEKGTFTDANLSPPHTNALCNASTFSKGSRVPYHWLCSQLACNSSLHRLLHRPTQWSLVFFFFKILNHDLISPLQLCGLEPTVPTKIIRGIMCFICEDDHQSSGSDRSARGKYTWLRIACGFTKFRF